MKIVDNPLKEIEKRSTGFGILRRLVFIKKFKHFSRLKTFTISNFKTENISINMKRSLSILSNKLEPKFNYYRFFIRILQIKCLKIQREKGILKLMPLLNKKVRK